MRRIGIVIAAAGIALVATAAPAFAHVKVDPSSAPKGSDAVLGFVVPNEEQSATTTKVEVQFPQDTPIPEAMVEAIPGWTAEVTSAPLKTPITTDDGTFNEAVKNVTWTATGTGIAAEHFQIFRVSVGLPDADSLTFPTIQTYSDGKTANWVQVTPPGGPEPDDPAPVLTLTASDSGHTTPTTAATASDTASQSDVDSANTLAIIAVIIGAVGLLVAVFAVVASRRKPSAGTPPSA